MKVQRWQLARNKVIHTIHFINYSLLLLGGKSNIFHLVVTYLWLEIIRNYILLLFIM